MLHQAALASVRRPLAEPEATHQTNVTGSLNLLLAARDANVSAFVYASSCAVYGDAPELPKKESQAPPPLSPYATTKLINKLYADVFASAYGFQATGLRYFNIYGPRQDPNGAYAAVIPKWIAALARREPATIYGDGETSRDLCFIADVVQANLLAATAATPDGLHKVYNVGSGQRTTLNQLFQVVQDVLGRQNPSLPEQRPLYQAFRPGDVRHSVADISKAQRSLGYTPHYSLEKGLEPIVGKPE